MGAEFAKQSIGKQSKGKEGGYSDDALRSEEHNV